MTRRRFVLPAPPPAAKNITSFRTLLPSFKQTSYARLTDQAAKVSETIEIDKRNGRNFIRYLYEIESLSDVAEPSVVCTNAHVSLVADASFADAPFYVNELLIFIIQQPTKPKIILISATPQPFDREHTYSLYYYPLLIIYSKYTT